MGKTKVFTPEQELEVCEMYERVERGRIVAEAYGVSTETIYRVLRRHGVLRTHRHPKPNRGTGSNHKGIDRSRVGELYEEGFCITEIARELGCSFQTVCYHLERLGLYELGQRKAANDALVPRILELHGRGISDYEIAERLGCGRNLVNKRLLKAGIRRGKDGRNGGAAYAKKMRERAIERLDANPAIELVEFGSPAKVRCKRCGTEYEWTRESWKSAEPCPGCRELQRDANRAARDRKQYEREQQREAAREWRLSVPHICKECGEPFYSEHENVVYCCDACRKRVKNRRKKPSRVHHGNQYKRRMRVKVTRLTYDRTVTLDAVYKKYRGRCCECGCETERTRGYSPRMATLDHIVALGNYGTHTWDNVQLLCSDCNSRKRDLGQMRLPMAI